jgi:hypothetical protein
MLLNSWVTPKRRFPLAAELILWELKRGAPAQPHVWLYIAEGNKNPIVKIRTRNVTLSFISGSCGSFSY